MADFYDNKEKQDREQREDALFDSFGTRLKEIASAAPAWKKIWDGIDLGSVSSRDDLAKLPVFRKESLLALQSANPPFGGVATGEAGSMQRLFMSPGPIFEPQGHGSDWWGVARSLFAAGARSGEIIHNSFSYHLTPAGMMFESGAHALGCAVIPAGIGNTQMQVELISHYKANGYAGTPDYLKVIVDKADEMGKDISSLTSGLVGGAALPESLRAEMKARGITVVQSYGTADLGIIAYETAALEGMVINEDVIVEIVRPGTGETVPDGEVGEVVVTRLAKGYPLIRFATGDMSAILAGQSPCGRTNQRIKGWMGRADQRTKVKGMFIDPKQVAGIAARHSEVMKARLVVTRHDEQDVMTLRCAVAGAKDGLQKAIEETLRDVTKMRGAVELVDANSLPNDGKVIADERSYD